MITLCVALLSFIAGGYFGIIKVVNNLQEPSNIASHPTYIYSAPVGNTEGSTRAIATIFEGQNRRTARLEDMPPTLLNALVSKEDERFREHGGVDLWGIMRALYVDVKSGQAVEGASTITQQYVKNAYLSDQVSLTRKLKEAAIAIEIERRYSKDEILGKYLNTVYFGNNAYGIEAASETYFNKSTRDLSLSESATLIGLLWSPSTLGRDREAATVQRNLVLQKMFNFGYITRQDFEKALDEKLPERWPTSPMLETGLSGPPLTRNFAEYVRGELIDRYGANTVLRGGLSVYTTLNLKDQLAARQTLYGPGGYLSDPSKPDAALVSIEPSTGAIRAMVGGRDQNSQFNLATQARRQPGSSFKPFALIAALEQGISPQQEFLSKNKKYVIKDPAGKDEIWTVKNYADIERGPITLEKALWESDNTVFADLAMNADNKGLKNGPQAIIDVAHRLGITSNLYPHPSIVLGTQEVSPLEMATAYATIANNGRKVTPTAITKVVQDKGLNSEKVLFQVPPAAGEQVISPKIASEVTKIMEGDIQNGVARKASLGNRPAAGKSGTTENFFDAWFVGFTPQLATSVWLGYRDGGKTLDNTSSGGSPVMGTNYPAEIWSTYMSQALKGAPVEQFRN